MFTRVIMNEYKQWRRCECKKYLCVSLNGVLQAQNAKLGFMTYYNNWDEKNYDNKCKKANWKVTRIGTV